MTPKIIAIAGAVLLVSTTGAFAQHTVSPAATPSSNGKHASEVTSTPLQDPTLGSGQSKAGAKRHTHSHKHAAVKKAADA